MTDQEIESQLIKEFNFISGEINKIKKKTSEYAMDIKDQSDLHRYIDAQKNLILCICKLREG